MLMINKKLIAQSISIDMPDPPPVKVISVWEIDWWTKSRIILYAGLPLIVLIGLIYLGAKINYKIQRPLFKWISVVTISLLIVFYLFWLSKQEIFITEYVQLP